MTALAIVIPYRDPEAHFASLYPRLTSFPTTHHPALDFRIHLVEQAPGKPFNRGKLCNVGFAVARDGHDQVCFHDVDYVPLQAGYSPVAGPTRLIWYGAHLQHRYDLYFGGVVAFPGADFTRVNGFSNEFWGWGFEDSELRRRCAVAGLAIACRDGTFEALAHPHQGFAPSGGFNETASSNRALLERRWKELAQGEIQRRDGLSTLAFRILRRRRLRLPELPDAPEAVHVTVEI